MRRFVLKHLDSSSNSLRSRPNDAAMKATTGVILRALPLIPNRVKRLLVGLRSVTIDGNTLDVTVQLLLAILRSTGGLTSSGDVAAERIHLENLTASFKQKIEVAEVTNLSMPGPAGPIHARRYRPALSASMTGSEPAAPLLVFYHGGGFSIGSLDSHDDLCRRICRDGSVAVLSIEYRRAPEHKFPAAVEDSIAAYRWAVDNAADQGVDPTRIAVGGDSAGGTIAAVISQIARDESMQQPALQVLIYPATDYVNMTRSRKLFANGFLLTKQDMNRFRHNYLGCTDDVDAADPRVSPLLAADLSGLCPALVVTCGFDPLRDEGNRYAEALHAAGVAVDHREFASLVHGFASFFPLGGDCAIATTEVISSMRAHLSRTTFADGADRHLQR